MLHSNYLLITISLDSPNERSVSCQKVNPHVSKADCGYTSFHKNVFTINAAKLNNFLIHFTFFLLLNLRHFALVLYIAFFYVIRVICSQILLKLLLCSFYNIYANSTIPVHLKFII